MKINEGSDWELHLLRTGRFELRFNASRHPERGYINSWSTASGKTPSEVFGRIFHSVERDQLLELYDVLLAVSHSLVRQAGDLQRSHSQKLKAARKASLLQLSGVHLESVLSELRDLAQGGAT